DRAEPDAQRTNVLRPRRGAFLPRGGALCQGRGHSRSDSGPSLKTQSPAPCPIAAACLALGGMRSPCRDAFRVRSVRGDGAPKSAKSLWLVPRCDEARRRRTSSRLRNASRERPLEGRGGCIIREVRETGISRALHHRWLHISPSRG